MVPRILALPDSAPDTAMVTRATLGTVLLLHVLFGTPKALCEALMVSGSALFLALCRDGALLCFQEAIPETFQHSKPLCPLCILAMESLPAGFRA